MKKILALVVLFAATAMISCCGNNAKKAECPAAAECPAVECPADCCGAPAEAAPEAPAEAAPEAAPEAPAAE